MTAAAGSWHLPTVPTGPAPQARLFDATDFIVPAVTWMEPGISDDLLVSPDAVDSTGPKWVQPTDEDLTQ